jgi:dynein heavy chain
VCRCQAVPLLLILQDTIEGKLEKRAKGVFVPAGGKRLIAFIDDVNMPKKSKFGFIPPLELLKLWVDNGFWWVTFERQSSAPAAVQCAKTGLIEHLSSDFRYIFRQISGCCLSDRRYDRARCELKYVKDTQLLAAMAPPGGGRNQFSQRINACFSTINMTQPNDAQLRRIFSTLLNMKLAEFDDDVRPLVEPIVAASVEIYRAVSRELLPTPSKSHYLFNTRDLAKIVLGVMQVGSGTVASAYSLHLPLHIAAICAEGDDFNQSRSSSTACADQQCHMCLMTDIKNVQPVCVTWQV